MKIMFIIFFNLIGFLNNYFGVDFKLFNNLFFLSDYIIMFRKLVKWVCGY